MSKRLYNIKSITESQLKAARALLGWSGKKLSEASGVGIATIRRLETGHLAVAHKPTVQALVFTLEHAGIEFTGDPNTNPGVTLHLNKN